MSEQTPDNKVTVTDAKGVAKNVTVTQTDWDKLADLRAKLASRVQQVRDKFGGNVDAWKRQTERIGEFKDLQSKEFGDEYSEMVLDTEYPAIPVYKDTRAWLNEIRDKKPEEWDWSDVRLDNIKLNECTIDELRTLGYALQIVHENFTPDYTDFLDVDKKDYGLVVATQLQDLPDLGKDQQNINESNKTSVTLKAGVNKLMESMQRFASVRAVDKEYSTKKLWYELEPVTAKPAGFLKMVAQYTEGVTKIREVENQIQKVINKAGTSTTTVLDMLHDRHKTLKGFKQLADNSKIPLFDEIYANTDDFKFKNKVFEETLAHPKKVAVHWSTVKNKPQIVVEVDGKKVMKHKVGVYDKSETSFYDKSKVKRFSSWMAKKTSKLKNLTSDSIKQYIQRKYVALKRKVTKGVKAQAAEAGDQIQEAAQTFIGTKLQMEVRKSMYGGTLAELDQHKIYDQLKEGNKLMDIAYMRLQAYTEQNPDDYIKKEWNAYTQQWYDNQKLIVDNELRGRINTAESDVVHESTPSTDFIYPDEQQVRRTQLSQAIAYLQFVPASGRSRAGRHIHQRLAQYIL